MKISAVSARRLSWVNLPGALLLALLQRAPAVPAAATVVADALTAPVGAVLRSAFVAATSLGALQAMAGATQVIATQGSTITNAINTTVGTAIAPVVFATKGAPQTSPPSYQIKNVPPGLSVPGLNPANGILNTTTLEGVGQIIGTPTTAGTFPMTIQAWEFNDNQGSSIAPVTLLFTIASNIIAAQPRIDTQPADLTSAVGETAIFTVGVTANPAASYQWKKNGFNLAGATGASLSLPNLLLSDAGNYAVDVTNSFGTVSSVAASLSVLSALSAPVFLMQPAPQTTISAGATVVFTAMANGAPTPTYQWMRNGLAIAGATSPTLLLTGASAVAANYTVVATNGSNAIMSDVARLGVLPTNNPGHLKNLSVLTRITTTEPSFTVATVIGPSGISGNKPLLVRAAGPSLGQLPFSIPDALPDPKLVIVKESSILAQNEDWGTETGLASIFARVGAFPFVNLTSKDAAHYSDSTLPGSYSVQVSGAPGQTGLVIAEIYDAGVFTATAPRLINVSVLKTIPASELLSAGFVIDGDTALTVLVRAIGPALGAAPFGLAGVLADPKLQLFNSSSTSIAVNDNWGGDANLVAAMNSTGAFALADTGSKDAVLLLTLPPGSYSAQISGLGAAGGLALVEVYEVR